MPESTPKLMQQLARGVLPLQLQMLVSADAAPAWAETECYAAGWSRAKAHVSEDRACCNESDRS